MDGEEAAADAGEKKRMQSGFNSRAGKENQGIIGKRRREGSEERMQEKRRRVRKRRRWWQWWGGGSKREGGGGGGGETWLEKPGKREKPCCLWSPTKLHWLDRLTHSFQLVDTHFYTHTHSHKLIHTHLKASVDTHSHTLRDWQALANACITAAENSCEFLCDQYVDAF